MTKNICLLTLSYFKKRKPNAIAGKIVNGNLPKIEIDLIPFGVERGQGTV